MTAGSGNNGDRGCDKVLLVQAEFDGELDAAAAASLAAHRGGCPVCQAAAAELEQARTLLGRGDLYRPMLDDARARLMAQLNAAQRRAAPQSSAPTGTWWHGLVHWWQSVAGFALGAACAAALLLTIGMPQSSDIADQIVASHIRSLQPGHLEDVVSTDRHTVKPWFDGRTDFAPPVKDLVAEHFPLIGGRLDYIGGRPVAALIYQRDKHLINLFIWPAGDAVAATSPETGAQQGYNFVRWTAGGMRLWAVSDIEAAQLREFAKDWQRSP
jgi:anti-sigma factor RsiW